MDEFQRGEVVLSTAGRDKGSLLVVTGSEEGSVLLCDGKERPLERAKRKNIRHVEKTALFIDEISMSTNRKLRQSINRLSEFKG